MTKLLGFSLVIVLLCELLTGCDILSDYKYVINNESDSTLLISYKLKIERNQEVKEIPPSQSAVIFETQINNQLLDLNDEFLAEYFDEIIISYKDNLKIKKDLSKRKEWKYVSIPRDTFGFAVYGDNIYTLTITQDDLDNSNIQNPDTVTHN